MEINGASASAYNSSYDPPIALAKSTSINGGENAINIYVIAPDTVEISPEAAARAYASSNDGDDGEDDDSDDSDTADVTEASDAADESGKVDATESAKADDSKAADSKSVDAGAEPSSSKSFVYGALGLERPEQTQNKSTDGYDFGRWLSAGVTIGTIISVLV